MLIMGEKDEAREDVLDRRYTSLQTQSKNMYLLSTSFVKSCLLSPILSV